MIMGIIFIILAGITTLSVILDSIKDKSIWFKKSFKSELNFNIIIANVFFISILLTFLSGILILSINSKQYETKTTYQEIRSIYFNEQNNGDDTFTFYLNEDSQLVFCVVTEEDGLIIKGLNLENNRDIIEIKLGEYNGYYLFTTRKDRIENKVFDFIDKNEIIHYTFYVPENTRIIREGEDY